MISSGLNKDNLSFSPYSNYPHNINIVFRYYAEVCGKCMRLTCKAILQKELKVRQILVGGFASSIS